MERATIVSAYTDASFLGVEWGRDFQGILDYSMIKFPGGYIDQDFDEAAKLIATRAELTNELLDVSSYSGEASSLRGLVRRLAEDTRCVFCSQLMSSKLSSGVELGPTEKIRRRGLTEWDISSSADTRVHATRYEEAIWDCPTCGWWKHLYNLDSEAHGEGYSFSKGLKNPFFEDTTVRAAVFGTLRTFDLTDANIPLIELRRWLARHPDDAAHIDPFLFERLMADCFRDSGKYSQVRLIGGRSDRGIDLILVESEDPILVQLKRRSSTGAVEQVRAVRELNGVLLREGIPRGMIITTAGRFSRGAHREVELNRASYRGIFKRYRVDLVAMEDLRSIFMQRSGVSDPWDNHRNALSPAFTWVEEMRKLHVGPYD